MCPAKQFALTHVVIFVLCACNAADRLVCALRAFFIHGGTPHKARMTFVLLLAAKKSCSRFLFWFGAARR